jgi:hypothetical protein
MRLALLGIGLVLLGFVVGGAIGQATAGPMPAEMRDARLFPGLWGFDRALAGSIVGATSGLAIWAGCVALRAVRSFRGGSSSQWLDSDLSH